MSVWRDLAAAQDAEVDAPSCALPFFVCCRLFAHFISQHRDQAVVHADLELFFIGPITEALPKAMLDVLLPEDDGQISFRAVCDATTPELLASIALGATAGALVAPKPAAKKNKRPALPVELDAASAATVLLRKGVQVMLQARRVALAE